ncbi:hypothetical protein [uncultured Azohydromonas sp.]|jgi:hypothetical protein|uniref:hypothetical protein n=1 Tax=uncultured Azohydromonas sp. TaxID=487342 RepID=UPI0026160B93|nr:hypothetical protein [uncultured Azohydromonas sp.]
MAASVSVAIKLTADSPGHGQAAVHWRQRTAGWPPQLLTQHVARAFAEAYGGSGLWHRLA